ncbi:glycosyltransferase [Blastococcus sp. KM273129]|uniref:glycosyltransferase n=1 Tax=Blastococcus sp. KM273129 TaxID=2570315 RepID=UPI001F21818D|nr:glycosyltransferase [Blastococcus sp. KM273129]
MDEASEAPGRGPRPLIVLHSLRPPDGTTKYVDQIVEGAPPDVDVRLFTWWTALFGRYDVLHVHWPELLVRDSRGIGARILKRRLLAVLLLRLRLQRIPLVWTAHNLGPHEEGSAAEQRALAKLSRRIDLVIRLNEASPAVGGEVWLIPHGHYRDAFAPHRKPEAEPGRVLYFGLIRPYKGVDQLIEAFEKLPRSDARLRIVGQPHPGQAEGVLEACARDPRISSTLRFVDDAELVDEICRAQLVVLPYRGFMHNSGSLLAGLSLGRPVLVPSSPTNEALAEEVGPGWVLQHTGDLTPEVLEAALDSTVALPDEPPRLDGRDWAWIGCRHRDAYLRALALRRGR